jgi:glycosyltransferase involved in cell wall biosynthesis
LPDLPFDSIICFTLDDWSDIWRRRHHLMSRFAKQVPVLFVPLPQSIWNFRLPPEAPERVFSPVRNLLVMKPLRFLPGRLEAIPAVYAVNRILIIRQVCAAAHKQGFKKPLIWAQNVEAAEYIDVIPHSLLIYDNTEDWLEFFSTSRKRYREKVKVWDKKLMERADAVIVVSEDLLHKKKPFNPHTYWVQNGVDFDHFNKADAADTVVPGSIAQIPHPVLGYVGGLPTRLDFSLLAYVLNARPDWHFLIVGPVKQSAGIDEIKKMKNIHFTGSVAYKDLPGYIKHFDVCTIPHKVDGLTKSMNPLKLFEYLATGKPIVTMDVGGVEQFSSALEVGRDYKGFTAGCEKALRQGAVEKDTRLALALKNTWERRVDEIKVILMDADQRKNHAG